MILKLENPPWMARWKIFKASWDFRVFFAKKFDMEIEEKHRLLVIGLIAKYEALAKGRLKTIKNASIISIVKSDFDT